MPRKPLTRKEKKFAGEITRILKHGFNPVYGSLSDYGDLKKMRENVRKTLSESTESKVLKKGSGKEIKQGSRHSEFRETLKQAVHEEQQLRRARQLMLAKSFEKSAGFLKAKIPRILLEPQARNIAQQKISRLFSSHEAAGRFEKISIALRRISGQQPFKGAEALRIECPQKWIRDWEKQADAPATTVLRQINLGAGATWFPKKLYNSIVFFEFDKFISRFANTPFDWGFLKDTTKQSVLGIMVFDPNPSKLLETAKAIAKRTPQNPIPIFDIYGNVFYP